MFTNINFMKNIYKILMIGDTGTGKSSILSRYSQNYFSLGMPTTVGIDFVSKVVNIDQESIELQIWDTAGQEKYRSITTHYYRGCDGIIICCDLADIDSINNIDKWFMTINDKIGLEIPIIIVINKCDEKERTYKIKLNEEYVNIPQIYCSALNNININNIFEKMITAIHKNRQLTNGKNRLCMPLISTPTVGDITIDINEKKKDGKLKNNKCC